MNRSYLPLLGVLLLSLSLPGQSNAQQPARLATPAASESLLGIGNTEEDNNKLVSRHALGTWVLREDPQHPGLNCSIKFLPVSGDKQDDLSIMGPSDSIPVGVLVFSGKRIPFSPSIQATQVELRQQGFSAAKLEATQFPPQQDAGLLVVATGDFRRTVKSMRDSAQDMQLFHNGVKVFSISYEGLDGARSALLGCLDGKSFAGKTINKTLAELRPVGKSTITGQAYIKTALLARKQYPPKGSEAISLLWMTDEVKTWFETAKQQGKLPETVPSSIYRYILTTKVVDDEGHFTFTKLPPGEYLIVASFNYDKSVQRRRVSGRTDVYHGNQNTGSYYHYDNWAEKVKVGTNIEKQVHIAKDGDTLDVTVDESAIFCLSC